MKNFVAEYTIKLSNEEQWASSVQVCASVRVCASVQ